jgi:hypothetical protein
MQIVDARNGGVTHRIDDVALFKACASRRTVWLDRRHAYGTRDRELFARASARGTSTFCPRCRYRLAGFGRRESAATRQNRAVLTPIRKAKALRGTNHRRVDADDLAARVTSGPPELPGLSDASVWMMSSISRPIASAESGRGR